MAGGSHTPGAPRHPPAPAPVGGGLRPAPSGAAVRCDARIRADLCGRPSPGERSRKEFPPFWFPPSAERIKIIFAGGVYVSKNLSHAAKCRRQGRRHSSGVPSPRHSRGGAVSLKWLCHFGDSSHAATCGRGPAPIGAGPRLHQSKVQGPSGSAGGVVRSYHWRFIWCRKARTAKMTAAAA